MKTNCPCDEIVFPPELKIPAGLTMLPRQIATFPEFRAAMLATIGAKGALNQWRARRSDDYGVMLLEMWSYVCDCVSFYDEVIACESYVRTTKLRPSLRKLVALLGYLPRPAIGATVDLVLLADGRQPIVLPRGTAFRSGGFPGGTPQVFELDGEKRVHPFTNKWTLARRRPLTLEPGPGFTPSRTTLLLDPKDVRVKVDQLVLVEDLGQPSNTRMRTVKAIDPITADDDATYSQLTLSASVPIPGNTPAANVRLRVPTQTATIWQHPYGFWESGLIEFFGAWVVFDSLHRSIQLGDRLVLDKSGDTRWFTVIKVGEVFAPLPPIGPTTITSGGTTTTVTPPAPRVQVTYVQVDASFNDPARRDIPGANWTMADAAYVKVHLGFRPAGAPTVPAEPTLKPGEPMVLTGKLEMPQDGKVPGTFILEDKDEAGIEIAAAISFPAATLSPMTPLAGPLVAPIVAYGNVVTASRGETVPAELLGSGDASLPFQTFKLKKSPLTHFAAPQGAQSTLKVYVDGVRWTEVPSFFGVASDAEAYIVRQDDAGDSFVTFGGGRRLSTGANVVASYRFGAGKATPPAGSIHQMARPFKGIASVRNPVAAGGGDDAEPAAGLRSYAPRSALLLGRAISIPDMGAAAANVPGVRAVRAEWRWNAAQQRPVVQVWYIGATSVRKDVVARLNGLSDSVTPIAVDQAVPIPASASLSIEIDPRRIDDQVLAEVRDTLMNPERGLLAPEQIGIGAPLFRSRIFEAVLGVPGATAVTGLLWNGVDFNPYGLEPGAGQYFDLESGALLLNGKAGS